MATNTTLTRSTLPLIVTLTRSETCPAYFLASSPLGYVIFVECLIGDIVFADALAWVGGELVGALVFADETSPETFEADVARVNTRLEADVVETSR